jgi:hypothetical protein
MEAVMAHNPLEPVVKKLVGELALVRAQQTMMTVFLDRLEGFSREQFEREFSGFWEMQGPALAQSYSEELGLHLSSE